MSIDIIHLIDGVKTSVNPELFTFESFSRGTRVKCLARGHIDRFSTLSALGFEPATILVTGPTLLTTRIPAAPLFVYRLVAMNVVSYYVGYSMSTANALSASQMAP